jgi:hypothetical protein
MVNSKVEWGVCSCSSLRSFHRLREPGLLAALFNARRFLVAVWIDLSLFNCMLERSRHS